MRRAVHLTLVSALVASASGCLPTVHFRDGGGTDSHATDIVADGATDAADGAVSDAIPIDDVPVLEASADVPECGDTGACEATVRLMAPLSGSVVSGPPALRFELNGTADSAEIMVCRDRAMTAMCQTFTDVVSGYMPTTLAAGPWFWRAHARTNHISGLDPSRTWEFFIPVDTSTAAPRGAAIATVPDVNGDGLGDAIIGSAETSRIHIVLGGSTINPTAMPVIVPTGYLSESHTWLTHCDVDGDGLVDIIVGAPTANSSGGDVSVIHGNIDTIVSGDALGAVNVPGDTFGFSVACIGDFDGDGYGDVAVGLPGANSGSGRVDILRGPALDPTARTSLQPTSAANGRFGYAVAGGDLDGDGDGDVLVGEPQFMTNQGRITLARRMASTFTSTAIAMGVGSQQLGLSVATVGDVNDDGVVDYAFAGIPLSGMPIVRVFRSGTSEIPIYGPDLSTFGASIAGIDLTRDGKWEVVVGGPTTMTYGAFFSFLGEGLGNTGSPQYAASMSAQTMGASVAFAGDMNGDGYPELLVGAPGTTVGTTGGAGIVIVYSPGMALPPTELIRIPAPSGASFGNAISR